jgi:dipeptidase E
VGKNQGLSRGSLRVLESFCFGIKEHFGSSEIGKETIMKLLLTSAGIKNDSIHNALVDLLGKPIAESSALCIPTAVYAMPGGAAAAWRLINGVERTPLCELGWKSLGVLELTALPSINEDHWVPMVQETDALLVGGGDPLYLCYWMRQSGLADLLPELPRETVYVGVSAGSMVMTSNVGEDFVCWNPPTGSDRALGLVDFSLFPHLDHPEMPDNSLANAERWAAGIPVPAYAIDDQTAIKVTDGAVEVVSEGHWKRFTP